MKIGEILELTKTEALPKIAKEHLSIGESKAREALKKAGCFNISGKRGWFYDDTKGDGTVLELSIYDFVQPTKLKVKAQKPSASINDSDSASKEIATAIETPANESKLKASKKEAPSELDSIDLLLLQNQKESEQRLYRGFYWDKDIIDFIDSVKHGNKSDLMNEIVRTVLKEKGLV